jgi:hypothetical protein
MKKAARRGRLMGIGTDNKSPRRKTGRALADAMIASLSEN